MITRFTKINEYPLSYLVAHKSNLFYWDNDYYRPRIDSKVAEFFNHPTSDNNKAYIMPANKNDVHAIIINNEKYIFGDLLNCLKMDLNIFNPNEYRQKHLFLSSYHIDKMIYNFFCEFKNNNTYINLMDQNNKIENQLRYVEKENEVLLHYHSKDIINAHHWHLDACFTSIPYNRIKSEKELFITIGFWDFASVLNFENQVIATPLIELKDNSIKELILYIKDFSNLESIYFLTPSNLTLEELEKLKRLDSFCKENNFPLYQINFDKYYSLNRLIQYYNGDLSIILQMWDKLKSNAKKLSLNDDFYPQSTLNNSIPCSKSQHSKKPVSNRSKAISKQGIQSLSGRMELLEKIYHQTSESDWLDLINQCLQAKDYQTASYLKNVHQKYVRRYSLL